MEKPAFWNHNAAYYPWIRRQLDRKGARSVLDVGCGEGSLARFLAAPGRKVLGIDPDPAAVDKARERTGEREDVRFSCVPFEDYEAPGASLDGIVFVASLHHVDGEAAIRKAKALLKPGGLLLVVGLAKPGGLGDWILEGLRFLPNRIGSILHRERTTEELGLSVSYDFPKMTEVRGLMRRELPGARLRWGLYSRYLLSWTKP